MNATGREDGSLMRNDALLAIAGDGQTPPFEGMAGPLGGEPSPEEQYTTRYFAVSYDESGEVVKIHMDYISSISEEQALSMAEDAIDGETKSGYVSDYRYRIVEESDRKQDDAEAREETESLTRVIFIHAANDIHMMQSTLLICCLVGIVALALIFLLIYAFSGRVILPYVRNIERQKRFITDASHELKTPLTSIGASADILAMEDENNEWIENIQRQTLRMSKLVKDLVTLSRLDEETPLPEVTSFSLSEAAWETAQPFEGLARSKGKALTLDIAEDLWCLGERAQIQKLFSILLDNAVRYSTEGADIRFQAERRRRKLVITVENPCELPAGTDLSRLFDRFYRPDSSRSQNTGGTGIGLSIAEAVVSAHGCEIGAGLSGGRITLTVILRAQEKAAADA